MLIWEKKYFRKYLHFFPLITYIFISYIYYTFCYPKETDFDYPMKMRLNNGNYLVMTTQGIYLYNEQFNSVKKTIKKFSSRLLNDNEQLYSADMAQFLNEDNGYIICLLLNEVYIISKNGEFLCEFYENYTQIRVGNQIIPYKHDRNNYYFTILSIQEETIYIRKYIYDSSNNIVEYDGCDYYTCLIYSYSYLSCELMKYLNEKVIYCFYGGWNDLYYVVLEAKEINNFTAIEGRYAKSQ